MLSGVFFFQAEDGIRDLVRSRGLGDVYKRQEHACRHDRRLSSTAKFIARMQVPFRPERTLTRDDREVRGYLTSWSSPRSAFPSEDDVHRYAVATALPFVAHSAAEYFRWFGRNQLRWDCLLYTSPSPRDRTRSRMPPSA